VQLTVPVFGPLEPIPHDLAHYVVEREMDLQDGFWGSVAAGAVFGGMRIVSGRQRPHAADRSKAVIAANGGSIGLAEQMVGAVMAAVEGRVSREPPLASHPRTPKSRNEYLLLVDRLTPAVREVVDRWHSLPVGGTLVVQWPDPPQHQHHPRPARRVKRRSTIYRDQRDRESWTRDRRRGRSDRATVR
jgi:hypothetical protein